MSEQHVEDLLALYALGGLEPDGQARVEAHLAGCSACQAEAARLQAAAAAVGASVPARRPPAFVREQVLRRIGQAAPAAPRPTAPAARPAQAAPRAGLRYWLRRLAPAALTAALAALIGWNAYLTAQLNDLRRDLRWQQAAVALLSQPDTQQVALAALAGQGEASGRAYVDATTRDVVLIVENLAPPAPGQTYQAWVITGEGPQDAGLLDVTPSGWGMAWLTEPYAAGADIGVSVEPEGGSEMPGEVVLLGGM